MNHIIVLILIHASQATRTRQIDYKFVLSGFCFLCKDVISGQANTTNKQHTQVKNKNKDANTKKMTKTNMGNAYARNNTANQVYLIVNSLTIICYLYSIANSLTWYPQNVCWCDYNSLTHRLCFKIVTSNCS